MSGQPDHRDRWAQARDIIASVGVAVLVCVVIFGTYTLTWPYEPITRLVLQVPPVVQMGDVLPVQVDYCKTMRISPEGRWSLQDGIVVELRGGIVALPVGCAVRTVNVPLNARTPPGHYRAVVEATYTVWPWRTVRYRFESNQFVLVSP